MKIKTYVSDPDFAGIFVMLETTYNGQYHVKGPYLVEEWNPTIQAQHVADFESAILEGRAIEWIDPLTNQRCPPRSGGVK